MAIEGPLDAVNALAGSRLRETDKYRLGHRAGRDVDFDFNRNRLNPEQRVRMQFGQHEQRRRSKLTPVQVADLLCGSARATARAPP